MSTRLTKAGVRSRGTESRGAKNAPTLGSCQSPEASAQPNHLAGSPVMTVMTAEETASLLARLQDILSMWPGSDNQVIGMYVMTALPISVGVTVGKQKNKKGHDTFSVNQIPVVALE